MHQVKTGNVTKDMVIDGGDLIPVADKLVFRHLDDLGELLLLLQAVLHDGVKVGRQILALFRQLAQLASVPFSFMS